MHEQPTVPEQGEAVRRDTTPPVVVPSADEATSADEASADEATSAEAASATPAAPQPARSHLRTVLAIAIVLTGLVWMLQGLGILTGGRSFMIGDPTWTVIGGAFVLLGIGLGLRARQRRA